MAIVSARVRTAQMVASNVIHLQIERPDGYAWQLGQFARIGLNVAGEEVFRAYSIASTPESDTIDFFIAHVTDGALSPRLHALKAGDELLLDTEVNGTLLPSRLEEGGKYLWLMSTGTGVAPFIAMLSDRALLDQYERVILVHGVRTWDESGYLSRHIVPDPKIQVICSVTREEGAMLTERIPEALESGALEKIAGVPIEQVTSRVLLCGNPGMVKGVRNHLKSRSMVSPRAGKPGQVLAENFWL